jgi:vacuolar-type H+-ATPase subunit I/STV1
VTSTQFSILAASKRTGKSRTTITKHIEQGKLSVTLDSKGNKVVDASELIRVYGDSFKMEPEEGAKKASLSVVGTATSIDQNVQAQLHSMQQLLDRLEKERERERTQLEARIDSLEDALKRSQEAQTKALLLLEHRSGGGELQAAIKAIEEKIANQDKSLSKEKETIRENARRDTLEEIKSLAWWKVVFARERI